MAKTDETVNNPLYIILRVAGLIILGLFLLNVFFNTFYTIDTGTSGVVLTFGKASTLPVGEGLHIKIPFVQQVVKMNIQTQKYEADASAASKDLQIVSARIAINYRIDPEKVPEIFTKLGLGFERSIIQPSEQEVVKAITAKFTAEELITKREEVRLDIKELLVERLRARNIIVEEISITNFDFSKSFNDAIESKVTAEQLKLKAERDLERIKVEAQQIEANAIGKKQAAIAEAEGNAESIRIIQEQLSKSPQYVEYLKTQKWDGKLPIYMGNGVTPFVDVTQ